MSFRHLFFILLLVILLTLGGSLSTSLAQNPPSNLKVLDPNLAYNMLLNGSDSKAWVIGANAIAESAGTPDGEALRTTANPSVTTLVLQRIDSLHPHQLADDQALASLACALALWDGQKNLAKLQDITSYFSKNLSNGNTYDSPNGYGTPSWELTEVLNARIRMGDNQAITDYQKFILNGPGIDHTITSLLMILWRNPDDPAIMALAKQAFSADGGWAPTLDSGRGLGFGIGNTKLLGLDSYRDVVIQGLSDTRVNQAGSLESVLHALSKFGVFYKGPGSPGFPSMGTANQPLPYPQTYPQTFQQGPSNQPQITLRNCDIYACAITGLNGAPAFSVIASDDEKDKAIHQMSDFLQHYTYALQYHSSSLFRYKRSALVFNPTSRPDLLLHPNISDRPGLVFPPLDHPATLDDVRSGKALFSLSDLHVPTRVIPLDSFPSDTYIDHREPGMVWQAEAFLDNSGVWHPVYGYVARNSFGKLPASKIPPVLEGKWCIDRLFQGELTGLEAVTFPLNAPILIKLAARNPSPEAMALPASLSLPNQPIQSLPISISLYYSAPNAVPVGTESIWSEVTLKPPTAPAPSTTPPTIPNVAPLDAYPFASYDLRSLYDLSRPGDYVLTVGSPLPGTGSSAFSFTITP